jgi:hypothetical protein
MPELESLLGRLIERQLPFVIVGGYAAMAHGVTLVTQDIDVCIEFTPDKLFQLRDAVADLHPVHRMTPQRLPLVIDNSNVGALKNLYLDTDWGSLDCLSEVKGIGKYDAVLEFAQNVMLPAGRCAILNIDGLIKAKEAMNRTHDQLTILQLRAIQRRQQDG